MGNGEGGLGYDGLRGVLAIEFDFKVDSYHNDPADANTHISIMKANPSTGLLSSNHLYELARSKVPFNFVNSEAQGFNSTPQIEIGLMPLN